MINNWNHLIDQFRKNKYIPLAIAGLFSLITLVIIIQLIIQLQPMAPLPSVAKQKPIASPHVAKLHLMGIYDEKATELPLTQLQLTLQGTVVDMDNPTHSRALVLSPGSHTKIYKPGDMLPGNARLEKIHKLFVVLNDNGQLQKLRLPIKVLPSAQVTTDQ